MIVLFQPTEGKDVSDTETTEQIMFRVQLQQAVTPQQLLGLLEIDEDDDDLGEVISEFHQNIFDHKDGKFIRSYGTALLDSNQHETNILALRIVQYAPVVPTFSGWAMQRLLQLSDDRTFMGEAEAFLFRDDHDLNTPDEAHWDVLRKRYDKTPEQIEGIIKRYTSFTDS